MVVINLCQLCLIEFSFDSSQEVSCVTSQLVILNIDSVQSIGSVPGFRGILVADFQPSSEFDFKILIK